MSLSTRTLIAEFDKQWDHGLDPDVGAFVAAHDPLSSSQLTHLLLIDQSRRWAGGDKVSAEDYFKRFPDLLNNAEAAIDLLFAEFLLREESDPSISIDKFANRYPQFADELRRQVEFHRTVGTELIHDDSDDSTDAETGNTVAVEKNAVPGYEILGELGRGGLGVVYLARNLQLNRKVALKMLLAGKFASNNLLKRLLLEAEATARLQHPNIVQIFEVGQHDGHPFLALEYISGGTLAQWMERRPQSPRDAANMNQPIVARHTMLLERGWRWCRRNPVKTTLAALVASVLLMVALVSSVYSIMLGNQLAITTKSEITEKSLKIQALDKLWESSVSRADALRTSRQVGQRFESLKAIDVARELGKSVQFEPNQIDRMRNATIAALALSDMRIDHQWKKPWPNSAYLQSYDGAQTVCAYLLEPTLAVVQRISDGVELARFENVTPESKLTLSRDGTKLAIYKDRCRVYELNSPSHELLFESTGSGPWTFSGDGKQLIGTDGGQLKLVDLQSPQSIKVIGNFRGKKVISISPDSQCVAMWVDHSIQVVELSSGKVLLRVAPPGLPSYQSFEWHPNSKILAIRSDQHGIELWDIAGGERLKTIPAFGPCWFVFDMNGSRLLTYQVWSEILQLWDVISGEQEFSQRGQHFHWIGADHAGGFSLIQSLDSEIVAKVSIPSPTVFQTIPALRKDSARSGIVDLSYSRDGRFLVCSNRGELEIFDALSMTSLARAILPGSYVRFDFDGSLITSNYFRINEDGYMERGINRWKLSETKEIDSSSRITFGPPELMCEPYADISNAHFEVGGDGKIVAVPIVDGVSMWSTEQAKSIRTQAAHADVRCVSISPDGKRLASGGWNGGNVCIWDTETGELQHTILEPSQCTVQFSPDGKLLVTNSSAITVWDAQSWKELYKVRVPGQPNSGVSVCFSPNTKTLAASDSLGRIHLIDLRSGREFLLLTGPTEKQTNFLQYSPDGRQLAVVTDGNLAHVWHLDAIQAELDARNLGWQTGEEIAPQVQGNATDELSATKTAPSKLPNVDILFDERFRQLEASEEIERAGLAAAKFEFASARAAIARALALKPHDPQACNNLAWLLATGPAQLRDPEKAIELAQIAMQNEDESNRSLYANTLGVAQYRASKFQDASEMLKQSLANQPPDSQSFDLYFLSMCSSKLGDHAAARDFFDRAETLKHQFRSKLPFDQQAELDEFSKEAKSLLSLMR